MNEQYVMLFILGLVPLLFFSRSAFELFKKVRWLRSRWLEREINSEKIDLEWNAHFTQCTHGVGKFMAFWGILIGTLLALGNIANSMSAGSASGIIVIMLFPYALFLGGVYSLFASLAGVVITHVWIKNSTIFALIILCLIVVIGYLLLITTRSVFN